MYSSFNLFHHNNIIVLVPEWSKIPWLQFSALSPEQLSLLTDDARLSDVLLSLGVVLLGFATFSREQAGKVAMWASRSKSLPKWTHLPLKYKFSTLHAFFMWDNDILHSNQTVIKGNSLSLTEVQMCLNFTELTLFCICCCLQVGLSLTRIVFSFLFVLDRQIAHRTSGVLSGLNPSAPPP